MSLLSYKDLLVTESSSPINMIDSVSVNESLFEYGLECMRESNNQIRAMLAEIMEESGYMVNESFKEEFNKRFNFKNIVESILKLFIGMIRKLYDKSKSIMLQIIYDDKTISKYKDAIESYNKSINVDFDHYNYTNLGKDIPSANLNLTFSAEYEELQDKLEKIGKTNNKEKVIFQLGELFNSIQNEISHGYYDKLRRSVLGDELETTPIFADQYDIELRRTFRAGAEAPNRNDFSATEIHETLRRFLKGKELVKGIEKHKKDIESSAEKAKKNINKISVKSIMSDYVPIDYDIEYNLNRVLKLKCGQLSECCNIYTLAFAAKLSAMKESLVQDKKVLFKVIADIVSNGGEA